MAIFNGRFSPIRLLLLMFGKDIWPGNSDINSDEFRMLVIPKLGSDPKALRKDMVRFYHKLVGHDMEDVDQALLHYSQLVQTAATTRDWQAREALHEFMVNTFEVQVTEAEHKEVCAFLKNCNTLQVQHDELTAMLQMAEHEARYELQRRTQERFQEKAMADLDAMFCETKAG